MSPTSYQAAPPRVMANKLAKSSARVNPGRGGIGHGNEAVEQLAVANHPEALAGDPLHFGVVRLQLSGQRAQRVHLAARLRQALLRGHALTLEAQQVERGILAAPQGIIP